MTIQAHLPNARAGSPSDRATANLRAGSPSDRATASLRAGSPSDRATASLRAGSRSDRPTASLHSRHPDVVDGFEFLDHRTRHRSMPATGAPPGSYLSIQDGDELRLIALDRPIIHIGRGLIADVRLEDSQVSRRHAIVARRGDSVRVLDDRSSNGTYVNGRAVTGAYLSDGDVVRFGRVVFRYQVIDGPRRAPAPVRRIPLPVRGRRRAAAGARAAGAAA